MGKTKARSVQEGGNGANEYSPWQLSTARGRRESEKDGFLWAPFLVSGCGGLNLSVLRTKIKVGALSYGMHSCGMRV